MSTLIAFVFRMAFQLVINIAYVNRILFVLSWMTLALSFYFAVTTDEIPQEKKISTSHFYISSAWKVDASRTISNLGVPLIAFMIAILLSARYLQLREVLPHRSRILLCSLITGLFASLGLIATCAVTLKKNQILHLVLAGLCFSFSCISMTCLHLVESRVSGKADIINRPALYFRRFLLGLGIICGCLLAASFAHVASSFLGSMAEVTVAFCILSSISSFGADLSRYNLVLSLVPI